MFDYSESVQYQEAFVADETGRTAGAGQDPKRIGPDCGQVTCSKGRADDIRKMLHTVEGLLQCVSLEIEHQTLYADLAECRDILGYLFDRPAQQMAAAVIQGQSLVLIEP